MKDCTTINAFPTAGQPIPLPKGATAVHTITYLDKFRVTRFVEGCELIDGGVVPPEAWPDDAAANGFIRVWYEAGE